MKPLNWAAITPYAIHRENVWFSGRVMDVLINGNIIIVGTSHGGIWTVDTSSPVVDGFATACLTDSWDDPNVYCLAHGPDNDRQIYAGCEKTLSYFVLNDQNPITNAVLLNPISNLHIVYRILVQKEFRRIILATGAGLWWAVIPDDPGKAPYSWTKASGLPGDVISGLCDAGNGAIHAGMFSNGKGDNFGLFRGVFQNNNFHFTRSKIRWHDTDLGDRFGNFVKGDQRIDEHDMQRISLASCANNRAAAFASVSKFAPLNGTDKGFRGVLQYNEAQDRWEDILDQKDFNTAGRSDEPGSQGTFNNAIAVAPDDKNLVALGWQRGTYIFDPDHVFDGQKLQIIRLSKDDDPRIRGDVHGLLFTKVENGEHKFYIGSDGGLLKVSGPRRKPPAFDDRLNLFLPTLLFKDELWAKQYATIDVSTIDDGLIVGGLQDNGCKWLKTAEGNFTSWQQLLGGDGGTNTFLANGILISRESNTSSKFKSYRWNVNNFDGGSTIPLDVEIELDPKMEVCTRVLAPAFRNKNQQLMHAVSAAVQKTNGGTRNVLLGLFENSEGSSHFHWQIIGEMEKLIQAAAFLDGNSVFVSTDDGISLLSPQRFLDGQKASANLPLPDSLKGLTGSVIQFEIMKPPVVFALYEEFSKQGGALKGHILVYDGSAWKEIPTKIDEVIYSIAADWDNQPTPFTHEDNRLFFSTDNAVYQGVQSTGPQPPGFQTSFNWEQSTDGLPLRPHCTHLRLGWDDQKLFLYLSSYGRSVYRAQVRELVKLPGH